MKTVSIDELIKRMQSRNTKQTVIDRIVRLNSNGLMEGVAPRGYYANGGRLGRPTNVLFEGFIGKGEYIAMYGRGAWNAIPRAKIVKRGKRCYVAPYAFYRPDSV